MTQTTTFQQPLISVIIAVYNGEKYLQETIESVILQSETNWEIIAVNDGSTDHSLEILGFFEKKIPGRIHVISLENGGVSRARNIGVDNAKGKFLAFLDQDDLWTPDKLERQFGLFSNDQTLEFSFTGTKYIDENMKTVKDPGFILDSRHRGYVFKQLLLLGNFIPISSVMVKRDIFIKAGGFNQRFKLAEDFDFCLNVVRELPVDYIDQPLLLYRLHKDSYSFKKMDQMDAEANIVFNKWGKMCPTRYHKNFLFAGIFKIKLRYLDIFRHLRTWRRKVILFFAHLKHHDDSKCTNNL